MRDLEQMEKTMIKAILGIYHGRIAYPPAPPVPMPVASRSAISMESA
jgi:hypothetical protein